MRHYTANIEFSDSGGDAAAMGRPTRDEFGAFLFSIELAGRYEGVKLQIVAIDKFGKEMIQKSLMLVAGPLSLAFFCASPLAANGLIGSAAPYFRVQSGDDKELSLDMIKGKVVAIFYENKDIVDANKRLKDELNKLYYEQTNVVKDVLVRLPVIDCSDAFWPFRGLWKQKLREHSKKEGIAIYCDW